MTRNEAAAKVNEAFKAAKVQDAVKDPKAKGFSVAFEGHDPVEYKFKHGAHAHEQRKDEVAKLRLALVEEMSAASGKLLQPKAEEAEIVEPEPEA